MDEGIDNLIIEHLKGLRSDVQSLRMEMHAEFRDVKLRLVLAVVTYCANLAFRARPARIGLQGRRGACGWMSGCLRLAAPR